MRAEQYSGVQYSTVQYSTGQYSLERIAHVKRLSSNGGLDCDYSNDDSGIIIQLIAGCKNEAKTSLDRMLLYMFF